jgi:hypothetical protein
VVSPPTFFAERIVGGLGKAGKQDEWDKYFRVHGVMAWLADGWLRLV